MKSLSELIEELEDCLSVSSMDNNMYIRMHYEYAQEILEQLHRLKDLEK